MKTSPLKSTKFSIVINVKCAEEANDKSFFIAKLVAIAGPTMKRTNTNVLKTWQRVRVLFVWIY